MSELTILDHGSDLTAFKPEQSRKRLTVADAGMRYATKVRDLVLFEEAARAKVAEVRELVLWWDANIRNDTETLIQNAAVRKTGQRLTAEQGNGICGFTKQRISEWRTCLAADNYHGEHWVNILIGRFRIKAGFDKAREHIVVAPPGNPPGATADKPWGNVQHFDVWNFHTINGDSTYFGRMPPQVVENLLWFYTEPNETVVDPFAGGGTTIDVAQRMGRQIWASDLNPSRADIEQHNILDGWPPTAPDIADLIVLDPPYWQQAVGRYSDSPNDLANLEELADFYDAWREIVETCAAHMLPNGRLAFIVSPTQLKDGSVVDHATDMLPICRNVGLYLDRRIIVPYQTQQANGQQVTWARQNKRMLKLYRDLVVLTK